VCKCENKMLWRMKLLDLMVSILFYFSDFEQTNDEMCNRVWYVCESFRGPMEMVERDHYF
jgi:hypothetical protein